MHMAGHMSGRPRGKLFALVSAAVFAALLVLATGTALADPGTTPGDPGSGNAPANPHKRTASSDPKAQTDPGSAQDAPPVPQPVEPQVGGLVTAGPATGQNATPFTGKAPFGPPTISPTPGSVVGVGQPISINFPGPVANSVDAINAVHVSSVPPVPGKFYWMTPTQLRWRPFNFWPAHTTVTVDAGGAVSTFQTGDSLVATADDATHTMTITRNGVVEQTFPMSMGMVAGHHQTPNGTYYVLDKKPSVVMDSSTYGVPVYSAWGYRLTVYDAVKIDNSGNFIHSAPWSVSDQGKRDVSHGCINLGPENAKWFYSNFTPGDPVVVKNSTGGYYMKHDGASDWQM